MSEMDVTGQAFEDMQEQNSRLLQQLREKDDANFKLMSERIKSNQIYKLLKEEKEELADQVLAFKTQVRYNFNLTRQHLCVLKKKKKLGQGSEALAGYFLLPLLGGCPAAGCAEIGRKRGSPTEHPGGSGKGTGCQNTSTRAEQEEGEEDHQSEGCFI